MKVNANYGRSMKVCDIRFTGDPKLRHEPREAKTGYEVFLVRADGLTHTIYPADQQNPK
jgi:hypothetical protein